MKLEEGKILMAKLARIDHDVAELDAKRAELGAQRAAVWKELADGAEVDLRTLRKTRAPHRPQLEPASELDRARARMYLREIEIRRANQNAKK